MPSHPITAVVATLSVADPAACDRVGIAELVSASQRVRGWLDAFDATVAMQAARLVEPAASVLAGRRAARDVKAAAARGEVCAAMPSLHEALAAGAVSAGHVDAVARVAGHVDDDVRAALIDSETSLVEAASESTVEWFERHVRDLARRLSTDDGLQQLERVRQQRHLRRWTDRQTGLAHTHLDPEADARLSAVLDAAVAAERAKPETEERTFDQLRADAFITLVTSPHAGQRQPAEVTVLIDYDTLADGSHDHSVCETGDGLAVPPESVRRLSCDATIIPVVLNGAGVVLDVGRGRRVATADQRRALRAMYRTCGHPGCTVRFGDCDIHHVIEWIRQRGPTNLDNLLPLCNEHHHLVHERGWHLTLQPDRTITLHRPDHTLAYEGSTVDVAPTSIADLDLITLARQRIDDLVANVA